MDRYARTSVFSGDSDRSSPSEAWLFAQAILGKPLPNPYRAQAEARAKREQLEWLPAISDRHAEELRRLQSAEAEARRKREELEWAATISTRAQEQLRALERKEADEREASRRAEQLYEAYSASLTEWNEVDHPRAPKGTSIGGKWVDKGGGDGSIAGKAPSFLDAVISRNRTITDLTGVVTPSMIRSTRIAVELQSAAKLPGEVARAAAAGLGTGGKAVVNGFATAVKDTATLGLSPGQLELIGVTKEDRDRGYDTAASISTASGQVLIAVGTGGMASALSKGGAVARTASGALIAYDAAGNAVGVVKGVYDAASNGVTVANGAQVAAGALGISANLSAAKGLVRSRPTAPSPETPAQPPPSPAPAKAPATGFRVGKHGDMPSPRPGQHSHHGVMSEWMRNHYPGYDSNKAPPILMPDANHLATYGAYNTWRAKARKGLQGAFDWGKVSEGDIRRLSEEMFDAAKVPSSVRAEYWAEFERMKAALERQRGSQSMEAFLGREQHMTARAQLLTTDEMRNRYGRFYHQSPKLRLDQTKVPEQLWPLLPYAEFWGFADDWTRQDLVRQAAPDVQCNLKEVVSTFDDALDEWLAGPEAAGPTFSEEYIAFTALRMAADFA